MAEDIVRVGTDGDIGLAIEAFGKAFRVEARSDKPRVLVHADYPRIGDREVEGFIAFCRARGRAAMSGCRARVHPYRLLYMNRSSQQEFLVDIPAEVRGFRQNYPAVYSFIPALVYIPAGQEAAAAANPESLDMYVMPEEVLLDSSLLLDRLRLDV